MKSTLTLLGLGLGLCLTVPPAAAQTGSTAAAAAPRKLDLSKEARKALIELQAAVTANDVASIPLKVAAAQALAKTADDRYFIARQQIIAASAVANEAAIGTAVEAALASGGAEPAEVPKLHLMLGKVQFNAKQHDKAAASFQRVLALEPGNTDALTLLSEAQRLQGRTADALQLLRRQIDASRAGGQKPPEALLKRALALAYEDRAPEAVELSRQWVAAYPTPANWLDAIRVYRSVLRPDQALTLDALRLARAVGALEGEGDYHAYAFSAVDHGAAGEAHSVITEGTKAGKIDPARPLIKEITQALKAKATSPEKESLAERTKIALADPLAKVAVRVGDVHYGYGDYQSAAELYRSALTKQGADKDLINLHLGMALARTGDKAGAVAALSAVGGPRAELAKYWLIYASALS